MKQGKILIGILFVFVLQSCYYSKQAGVLLAQQQKTQRIDRLLDSPEISDDTREFLLLTQHIRDFAIAELGLKSNKNYTTYLELEKDYMVDVVQAAGPLSFEPHTWKFLFLGSLPYKGYFNPEDAQKEKRSLERKGLDVYVRKVQAFSRLGIFKDPVVSYMKKYSRFRLASLIIHEQVHATVFLKKHTQFNEELAEFIGESGAFEYLRKYGTPAEIEAQRTRSESYERYKGKILLLKERLQKIYDSSLPDTLKLERKEQMIDEFKQMLKEEYENIDAIPINNAYISCFQLYGGHDEIFQQLFERAEHSIPKMLEIVSTLDPKKDLYRQIEDLL